MKGWFEVSKQGLAELQGTKPKWRLIGELVQNAFDEPITECSVTCSWENGESEIVVRDDSPVGFRRLQDAYTLFGWTYKRGDPQKRGRFNLGEKTVLSVCRSASVVTTKGTIKFEKGGRKEGRGKTEKGTIITLEVKMTKGEMVEVVERLRRFIPPDGVSYVVDGEPVKGPEVEKEIETILLTEVYDKESLAMKRTSRKTKVRVFREPETWLYEIGIPVQRITAQFSMDVQQKVPLGLDRETVLPSFLQDLYSEVLNVMVDEVREEGVSEDWVRQGMSDERISNEVVKKIVEKRYGDKVVVPDFMNPRSIEEAVSHGYRVVAGAEMSKEEWARIREAEAIPSSSKVFGKSIGCTEEVVPEADWTEDQRVVVEYARMIARECLKMEVTVGIVKSEADAAATYGNRHLSFNTKRLSKSWWAGRVCEHVTDLILHELGHEGGKHWEHRYHEVLTKVGARLVMLALEKPALFRGDTENEG